jgi:hypothetical protein
VKYIRAIFLAVGVALAGGKSAPEDPEALLQKIRDRTAEHLAQVSNYTCHEVINRFLRKGSTVNRMDTVEIEVAFIGHEEVFARLGEDRFEERVIDRVVQHGTVANGAFGTHLDAIISRNAADFKFAGAGKKEGHKTFRFDFNVPLEKSRFLVKHGGAEGIVAYEGTVWVDDTTLDLVRVDLRVKRIPSHIGVRGIEEIIHYETMKISGSEILLPRKSELGAMDETGVYSLNLVELQSCRAFQSDSIVQYGSPTKGSASRERQDP